MTKSSAILIIHGFGGSTAEIAYLVAAMQAKGHDVFAVLLAGHGGTKRDLRDTPYQDWINSVDVKVRELAQTYDTIHLVGFSMGGLICTHLGALPNVDKIIMVNTPIYFWNVRVILSDIASGLWMRQFDQITTYRKSVTNTAVKTGLDFLRLLATSKQQLRHVRNKTLILQCIRDESVRPKSAAYLQQHSNGAEMKLYDGGRHGIFIVEDPLRETVCTDIMLFLR